MADETVKGVPAATGPASEAPDLDIEAAAERISGDLFSAGGDEEKTEAEAETEAETEETPPASSDDKPQDAAPAAPAPRAAPKTWPKEMHDYWAKADPKLQDYWELRERQMLDGLTGYKDDAAYGKSLREVIAPYKPIIAAQGADEAKAVGFLLNAHYRLSTAPDAERAAFFSDLARQYKVDLSKVQAPAAVAPEIKALQERVEQLQSAVANRDRASYEEARGKVVKEVDQFASDPAHVYFDEVADDIIALIKTGADLPTAYEKAVWANPVTRAKEVARLQTEAEAKAREKTKQEAEAARKAAAANVRSRDTKRTPTEPLGTMEDTMRKQLAEIKARAH